ncbi:MAG: PQQ-binding-like beta-propeller repeat protein, partial [Planctomycetes bacterium]|nr:PQQ-binding-like beta-propeller repeat protein [Planctomycetota bacterium]
MDPASTPHLRARLRRAVFPAFALASAALLSAALVSRSLPGDGPEEARDLVRSSGVQGGLVVHVGCGDGRRTAALRASERYIVQGLERDADLVAAARVHLLGDGALGVVSAVQWDGRRLPYADQLVNLLVIERAEDVDPSEVLRVLAPLGVACVRSGSSWQRIEKPWPDDIDEWTHFLRAPDNNAVAEDTRIAPPKHLQWVGSPRWARSHDHLSSISAAVSAAGRIFYIADEGPVASVKAPAEWRLVARDGFSGVLLWKKEIDLWEDHLRPFRSGPAELPRRLVAVGDRVYATLGYGKPVVALDAATGEVLRTYDGTENTHEILAADGKLFLVISEPREERAPRTGVVLRRFEPWRGAYGEHVIRYLPKHLRALDAESGELIWKKDDDEVANILPLTLTVAGGRVFFQNEARLVALDAASGRGIWRAERPNIRQRYAWLAPTVVFEDGVVLSADRLADRPVDTGAEDDAALEWRVSANHILTDGEIAAFSAETGEKLWTAPCHEGFNSPVDLFVIDGKVYSGVLAWGKQPGITSVYDLHTGEVAATRSPDQETYTIGFGHGRCYRHKATTKYVIQGRAGVELVDLSADRVIADHWVRGACQYGILPSNGFIYAPSHSCACYITAKLEGFNAVSGVRAIPLADEPARMERGPAYESEHRESSRREIAPQEASRAASVPASAQRADWPTFRGDASRSGFTEASLSLGWKRRWTAALAGPLTAVTAAGGRLYVARREAHTVCALSTGDGSPLWTFSAGGRIDSPPTVRGGLVYFGSADGWMYCVRAEDGALAWRVRVAPEDRQVVSYDQLESAWPVHGSVLVVDGREGQPRAIAYAAAGRSSYIDGGVHLCGVDASTGETIIRRRISHRDPETDQEPQGTIRGVNMPGAMPDVLACDGSSIFMRHQRFDLAGNDLPQDVDHLYTSAGFLDDSWWHRTYLQYGREMRGGYGGWIFAGKNRPSGRTLVMNKRRIFGFGRKDYEITGSHIGLASEYALFGVAIEPAAPAAEAGAKKVEGDAKKGRKKSGAGTASGMAPLWSRAIPF